MRINNENEYCHAVSACVIYRGGLHVALKNDAETQKLVLDINHARRASYQQLADSNHLPVDEVAKMAGQKLVERARPGEYVQGINGKWMRK